VLSLGEDLGSATLAVLAPLLGLLALIAVVVGRRVVVAPDSSRAATTRARLTRSPSCLSVAPA
jgi:hypothetical protein